MFLSKAFFKKALRCVYQHDRQQHFFVSCLLFFVLYFAFQDYKVVYLVLLVGLVKEIWDHYIGSGFCWWDMLANLIGAILGLIYVLTITYLSFNV